jgi:hypothetical protein
VAPGRDRWGSPLVGKESVDRIWSPGWLDATNVQLPPTSPLILSSRGGEREREREREPQVYAKFFW